MLIQFIKILLERKVQTSRHILINKYLNPEEKVFFQMYQKGKEFWKDSVVKKKRIGQMTYTHIYIYKYIYITHTLTNTRIYKTVG